ncbi:MAG: hypothetical protein ACRDPF_24050, partial [Streptosporangiaceae bacterium]
GRIRTVPVLITDTAFTAPAYPGPAQDIAVKAFTAGNSFCCWHPGCSGPDTQAAAASPLRQ